MQGRTVVGLQTIAGPGATASFPNLTPGHLARSHNPPPMLAIFCEGNMAHGNRKRFAPAIGASSGLPLEFLADKTIACDWFVPVPIVA